MTLPLHARRLLVPVALVALVGCHRKAERTARASADSAKAAAPAPPSPPPAPTIPAGEHPLLVIDWDEEGGAAGEVIGFFQAGGKYREVAGDSAGLDTIYAHVLDPGHRYTLLVAGRQNGAVTVRENDQAGCAANGATFDVQGARPNPPFALATDFAPPAGAPLRRPASAIQIAAVTPLLREALAAKGAAWLPGTDVHAAAVPMPDGHTVLVGWAETYQTKGEGGEPVASAFVIAENTGAGYQATHTWTRTQPYSDDDEIPQSRMLIDAADLDGDGAPELVTRDAFTEAWTYTVYHRAASGWAEAFKASGTGC